MISKCIGAPFEPGSYHKAINGEKRNHNLRALELTSKKVDLTQDDEMSYAGPWPQCKKCKTLMKISAGKGPHYRQLDCPKCRYKCWMKKPDGRPKPHKINQAIVSSWTSINLPTGPVSGIPCLWPSAPPQEIQ